MKIKQALISTVPSIVLIVITIMMMNNKENVSKNFIIYKEQTDFNRCITLNNFQYAYEIDEILEQLEYEPLDIVYTSSGVITVYIDDKGETKIDNLELVRTHSIRLGETVKKQDITPINLMVTQKYVNTVEITTPVPTSDIVNSITQSEYISNVLDIIRGNESNINKYFENDVLTPEIKSWLTNNIKEDTALCVYTGKSKSDLKYIDRLIVTDEYQDSDSEIKIKVFLKLNELQRVYDIDIY